LKKRSSLSSVFDVDVPEVPDVMTATEKFNNELRRYFGFEGGKGDVLKPLAWWKVSDRCLLEVCY